MTDERTLHARERRIRAELAARGVDSDGRTPSEAQAAAMLGRESAATRRTSKPAEQDDEQPDERSASERQADYLIRDGR